MRFVFCILSLVVLSGQASETSKGCRAWLSEGQALRHKGNYSAAAHAFREALAIAARSAIDDRLLGVLHDALAGVYSKIGQFAQSEGEYRLALALFEKTEGQTSLNYAVVLASMAVLPTQIGDRAPVIALLRNAIAANARSGAISEQSATSSFVLRKRLHPFATRLTPLSRPSATNTRPSFSL